LLTRHNLFWLGILPSNKGEKAHMNKHRIVLLCFTLIIALFVAACDGGAAPAPTQAATSVPEVEPTEEAAETETAPTEEAAEAEVVDGATETPEEPDEVEDTEEVTLPEGTTVTVTFPNTSARSGPGTRFELLGGVAIGTTLPVIARSDGSDVWYLVELESGEPGWLWGRVVNLNPRNAEVEVAATVPAPPES
jgi:uncharacterized protein YgiM (DUF1202 family)